MRTKKVKIASVPDIAVDEAVAVAYNIDFCNN